MPKSGLKSKIVKTYIKRFPDLTNKGLARKIYNEKDHNLIWDSVESIRRLIRYYKGQSGKSKSADSLFPD